MPTDTRAWELYVDGAFEESSGDDRIEVEYPYDGTVWATVPAGTVTDVDRAVASA